jgi:hypothetical protein
VDDRKNLPDHEALSTLNNRHPKPNFEKLQKRSCFIETLESRQSQVAIQWRQMRMFTPSKKPQRLTGAFSE